MRSALLPPDLDDQLRKQEERPAKDTAGAALAIFARFTPGDGNEAPYDYAGMLPLVRAAFAAGHVATAVAAAREMVTREPDFGRALFLLCAFLLRCGDPEAGELLQRCLARFPEPSPGWVELGDVLQERDQKEAALLCLARGVPEATLALRCGLLARDLGQLAEAASWFRRSVDLDPMSERGWFLLGTAAQDNRDFGWAAEAYRAVLSLNPDRVEAEVNLGIVLQEGRDIQGAKLAYGRALRARPDTFGRIAQALPGAPNGELWLDLNALRRNLIG